MRFVPVLFSSVAMLGAVSASLQAAVWPGAAPCDTTLQACIDGVPAGETVLVDSVAPVVEDLTIAKSLTLTSQVGPAATLEGSLLLQSGASAASIHLSDLIVEGTIRAVVGAGDLDLHLVGNLVISDVDNTPAVNLVSDFLLANAGNLTAEVRGNEIRVIGSTPSDSCGGIALVPSTSPQIVAAIVGNTLFVSGCGQGAAIGVAPGVGRTVTADVLRNQLEVPNTAFGISLQSSSPGPSSILTGRVVGNLVRGEFFGVGMSAVDSAAGTLTLQLINNTIVEHDTGVLIIANAGDPVSGEVANNIVAFNSTEGLRIDAAGVTNRHNLVFGNGIDNFTPGPGTVLADPQFVGGPSFHLLPGSPAIDAGANDAVPADVTTDLDGNPRIAGTAVDLGAFEELAGGPGPPPEPTPIPAISTVGMVLLGLLLVAAALPLLRRG